MSIKERIQLFRKEYPEVKISDKQAKILIQDMKRKKVRLSKNTAWRV